MSLISELSHPIADLADPQQFNQPLTLLHFDEFGYTAVSDAEFYYITPTVQPGQMQSSFNSSVPNEYTVYLITKDSPVRVGWISADNLTTIINCGSDYWR